MRLRLLLLLLTGLAALPAPTSAAPPAPAKLSAAEQAAVFRAAGFRRSAGAWRQCDGEPSAADLPGTIEQIADLNGDGLPEAVITESSGFCYGNTGSAFWLVGKQKTGGWKLLFNAVGMAEILKTRGLANFPDIAVGGPGFCFPVHRWNGKAYAFHRNEYAGKRCRR